jgi:hypothetical protein
MQIFKGEYSVLFYVEKMCKCVNVPEKSKCFRTRREHIFHFTLKALHAIFFVGLICCPCCQQYKRTNEIYIIHTQLITSNVQTLATRETNNKHY